MRQVAFLLLFLFGYLAIILSDYLPSLAAEHYTIAPPFLEYRLHQIAKAAEEKKEKSTEKKVGISFAEAIKNRTMQKGLFTLYTHKKTGDVLAAIRSVQLNRNFLMTITLASGLGENGIYSGFPLNDYVFQWRRVKDFVQLVIPNVRVRGRTGEPSQRSVQRSFSDSIIESIPIVSMDEKQGILLIDLSALLKKDLPNLTPILSAVLGNSYSLSTGPTFLDRAQAFPENVELQSVLAFEASGGGTTIDLSALPDGRSFNLRIHYSFSQLPMNSRYRPRIADERVGYFVTAYRDFGDQSVADPYIRYINRWHLEKKDQNLPLSLPVKPIVFWIENAVPKEYRNAVREGVLLWNHAFAKIGFQDAIEVRQMPDNATWDPADVRYSTVRWMNSLDATFALGPSRVNPLTGQILDADILIDGNFIRSVRQDYQVLASEKQQKIIALFAKLTGNPQLCDNPLIDSQVEFSRPPSALPTNPNLRFSPHLHEVCYGIASSHQLAIGSLALSLQQNILPNSSEMKEFLQQFIRQLVAHEVGHTLGLRHNFHGSALLTPQELNDRQITQARGLSASVMDYNPVNLAPPGTLQGDYFTKVLGSYDHWAIAYGYTPIESINQAAELEKIASRAPDPELAYATDEDREAELDPLVNAFDLSSDLLTFSQGQMDNARQLWQKMTTRYPGKGKQFSEVRNAFNVVFNYYFQYASLLPNYIGGQAFNRYRSGDSPNKLPFVLTSRQQQKQALEIIDRYVFADQAWQFSPELLNKLAPSRWFHWNATPRSTQLDYPIHEQVALLQSSILSDLLSSSRLHRLRNNELKSRSGESLTIPELFDSLQQSIWKEVINEPQPVISSWRRNLQRLYLNTLVNLTLRSRTTFAQARSLPEVLLAGSIQSAPEDARVIARSQLSQLQAALRQTLRQPPQDAYTRSHLEDSLDRVTKTLAAGLNAE